jgi:predicted DNA-binding protein YlxM (UPF0122 family)
MLFFGIFYLHRMLKFIRLHLQNMYKTIANNLRCKNMKYEYNDVKVFSKNPYRGILTEIAKENNCTRQNISQGIKLGNPRILEALTNKLEAREKMLKKYQKQIAEIA